MRNYESFEKSNNMPNPSRFQLIKDLHTANVDLHYPINSNAPINSEKATWLYGSSLTCNCLSIKGQYLTRQWQRPWGA